MRASSPERPADILQCADAALPDWDDFWRDLLAACSDAERLVFSRFAGRLNALARTRLPVTLAQKLDPEDVTQSVFRTFFRRRAQGEFELRSWDDLWTLLTVITVRKCHRWVLHFQAERRDVGREVPLAAGRTTRRRAYDWHALDREPTPDEAAMFSELLEKLLTDLAPRDRQIFEARLNGESSEAISERLEVSERTVQRVVRRVAQRLRERGATEEGE
jgi:RNA polymerase sigma-70 factor (ECF subfamily)